MVQFDNQYRQIKIKIVYYGPAVGGKTTCLQHIHRVLDPQRRTKLYSLNTATDRTLFFDLLSLNLGRIRGYRLALQLYTVPGQVQYNATRKTVLAGADGVVFVADSQVEQEAANRESLENLWENMAANGLDRATVPLVLQFNKRDLDPVLSVEQMEAALNRDRAPSFPTIAIRGDGVLEAFAAIGQRTLASVADKLGVGTNPQAIERLQQQMRSAVQPYMAEADDAPEQDDVEVFVPQQQQGADETLSDENLVEEAVRANLAMTDLNTRLDNLSRQLDRKVRVMASISEFGRAVSNERDPARVLRRLITDAIRLLQVQGAAVLIIPSSGELREAVVHGFKKDPLLAAPHDSASLADDVVAARTPRLLARGLDGEEGEPSGIAAVEAAGFSSAVAVPLLTQDKLVGLLTAYGDADRTTLDEDDLQLATVLGSTAAMGYANAIAWRQMEDFSRGLEAQVDERTNELRRTLAESRQLSADLEEKKSLLEDAYRGLEELDRVKNELINRLSLEFRTPVTSLFTAARVLQRDGAGGSDKQVRLVSVIHDEAEKLLEMIQSVFQAQVLTVDAATIEHRSVPVQELFRSALAPIRDLATSREVRLQVLIPSGLESIACEPESMEAAVRAVVKNGIEFNRPGGEVKLEVRRVVRGDDPWLQLRVRDTGTGIAPDDLPHIFDAFWQKDDENAGKRYGIGLGLTIAKRVVEHHGGTISVDSRLGEGTEVVLSVPQTTA